MSVLVRSSLCVIAALAVAGSAGAVDHPRPPWARVLSISNAHEVIYRTEKKLTAAAYKKTGAVPEDINVYGCWRRSPTRVQCRVSEKMIVPTGEFTCRGADDAYIVKNPVWPWWAITATRVFYHC